MSRHDVEFGDADADAADIMHVESSQHAAAAAAPASAASTPSRRAGAGGGGGGRQRNRVGSGDLMSQALAEQQAEGSTGRSSRKRAAVNYSEMGGDGAEDEEGVEAPAAAAAAAAAPPAKKRRSSGGSGAAAAAAPAKRRARNSHDDDYDGYDDSDEEEHKSASRKKRASGSGAAAAAGGKGRGQRLSASAIAAHAAGADTPSIDTMVDGELVGTSEPGEGDVTMSGPAARRWAAVGDEDEEGAAPYHAPDPTRVAECGILVSMKLKNFMNHKLLKLDFNPNVNFIHGPNGSGKSSILHAIQVVFGARASETSRGSSIAHLIHYDRGDAEVVVVVKNEGDGAFRHDQYGDAIRIVRHIRRKGASDYELRNHATGALVSKKSSEIRDLCSWFNIQVSNPCVIMTQEVSKKFLSAKDPEAKFEFFQQATQLEWLRLKLKASKENITEMVNTVKIQQAKIPDLDEKIKKLKKSEELAQEADDLQKEINELGDRMAWRQVQDLEIKFDLKEQERNTHVAALEKARAKRSELEAQFGGPQQLEEAKHRHSAVIERENRRAVDLVRAIAAKDQDVVRVKSEQKGLITRIDQLKKRIEALRRKKADNDAKIAAIAEANSRDTGAADAQRAERKEALLAKQKELQADRAKLQAEMEKLRQTEHQSRLDAGELNRTAQSAQSALEQARNRLHSLQQAEREAGGGGGASAAAGARPFNPSFGHHTPLVWQAIDRVVWQEKPIGPLGEYVQVKEEGWLPAVTECLTAKHMRSYIVDNFNDQQKLQEILQRVWQSRQERSFLPVVTVLRKRDRYPVVKPNVPFPLVMDQLQIDNDWAFNAVVMACKPERFGLHASLLEAVAAIRPFRNLGGGNDYVSGTFLSRGDKVSIKGRSHEGSTVSERPRERPMFRISQADRIRELQEQMQQAEASQRETAQACVQHGAEHKALQGKIIRLGQADKALVDKLRGVRTQLDDLEAEIENARYQQQQQDDSLLQDDNVRLLNEIGECEGDIAQLRSKDSSQFSERIDAINAERAELEAQMQAAQKMVDEEQNALQAFTVQWVRQDEKLKKYRAKEAALQRTLADLDVAFAAVSAELEKAEGEAAQLAPVRIDSTQSCTTLMAQLLAKEDTLRQKRARAPVDLLQVREDLKAATLDRTRTEAGMAHVLANQHNLQHANQLRIRKLGLYRKSLADSASFVFNKLLQQNGGSGRLEFDTANGRLHLIVNPNVRDADRADAANTVALSGGERSTTTIAFVTAVGEQVECPFRAIDEFDVFMDSMNRRVALNLLLSVAGMRKDRQFFFLSPLDITDIRSSTYLKVHALNPPVRNARLDEFAEREEGEGDGEGEAAE